MADVPDCPPGKGCEGFKKLWRANDNDIHHARWACFVTLDNLVPAGIVSRWDDFLLLTTKSSMFFFDVYRKGRLSESDVAVRDIRQARLTDATSWRPSPDSSGAITVTLDSDELRITRKYLNLEQAVITYKFAMRLLNGEFNSTSTLPEGGAIHHSGSCTELPHDVPHP